MADGSQTRRSPSHTESPTTERHAGDVDTKSTGSLDRAISIPGYTILQLIGEGGMGCVYLAREESLDRLVAVKTISERTHQDEPARSRFLREARTMASLEHPHVVRIYAFGEIEGQSYLVMEYVDGETLARRIWERGALPIDEVPSIATQCAEALRAAWNHGIVHCDVKPSNIMLDRDCKVRVTDFGIAKLASGTGEDTLSNGGGLLCTPFYASPEHLQGEPELDFRSDLYSLGIVLYEMLTGQRPYQGSSAFAVALKSVHDPLPDPRAVRAEIPRPVASLVEWMTRKDPRRRPDSYDTLLDALASIRDDPSRPIVAHAEVSTAPPSDQAPSGTEEGRFVGRERELATLDRFLERTLARCGATVLVTGEAGTGKSWLVREFARRAEREHDRVLALTVQCKAVPGTSGALAPFREVLDALVDRPASPESACFTSEESAGRDCSPPGDALRALVEHAPELLGSFLSPADALAEVERKHLAGEPWVAELKRIGEDLARRAIRPDTPLELIIERYAGWLRAIASNRPIVLVIDDLHWIDGASAAMLQALGRALTWPGLLIVGCYRLSEVTLGRDGGRHPLEEVANELCATHGEITVDLDAAADRSFVDLLVDREPNRLDEAFRDKLFDRTGGHALFTAELLRGLEKRGMLGRDPAGRWIVGGNVDWTSLPARVRAVVRERIERLSRPVRRLLEVASVIGVEFDAEVLARVLGIENREAVDALAEEGERRHRLVASLGSSQAGAQRLSRFRFTHVLFRNQLYDTLAVSQRMYLHESVGRAIEDQRPDETDDLSPALAHHFIEARIAEKALDYSCRAGRLAIQLRSEPEAIDRFQTALDILRRFPESLERDAKELEILLETAGAAVSVRGFGGPDTGRMFERAKELAERFGERPELCDAWAMLATYYGCAPRVEEGIRAARRAAAAALRLEDPCRGLSCGVILGFVLFLAGRPVESRDVLRGALRAYDPVRDGPAYSPAADSHAVIHGWLGHTQKFLGRFGDSERHHERAVVLAEAGGHSFTIEMCRTHWLTTQLEFGQWRRAEKNLERIERLCSERYMKAYFTFCRFFDGRLRFERGETDAAIAKVTSALMAMREGVMGDTNVTYPMRDLSEMLGRAGRIEEGLETIQEARAIAHATGERLMEPELTRIEGDLLRRGRRADRRQLEMVYRSAVELARSRQDLLSELRTALSLGDLWRRAGREDAARHLVSEVCARVDTSVATLDLDRARRFFGDSSPWPPRPDMSSNSEP